MRHQLEGFLLVLAIGPQVAIAAKRVGMPLYNVALVLVGLILVFLDVIPGTQMNPEVILVVFLPLLVFEGALFADASDMKSAARPILALALPGVMLSLVGTAAVATFALNLPFAVALLLGALLAITDTVSVLLAFRSAGSAPAGGHHGRGESVQRRDRPGARLSLATGVVASGHFSAPETLRQLLVAIIGGLQWSAPASARSGLPSCAARPTIRPRSSRHSCWCSRLRSQPRPCMPHR